ncbi:MAG: glycoside hydrolase family 2 protein [Spirochaetales bacterium]|nr:glycoside hydrolase family 2 protein [Spirochaetales bacterium]
MKKIDLSGNWRLIQADTGESIPVFVPGDNFSALLAAGKIPDPYYGMNENDVQWVGEKEWIFERDIEIDNDFINHGALFLFCEYLDTITEIYINGEKAGCTDNMFRQYRFTAGDLLLTGKNTITVRFIPTGKIAAQRAKSLPYTLPYIPSNKVPHMNTIRTNQCKMGWDWGICLPVCGIYGKIFIGAVNNGYITYVTTTQKHKKNSCSVMMNTEIYCPAGPFTGILDISLGDQTFKKRIRLFRGINLVKATIVIDNPRLWWPRDYGEQYLYDLNIKAAGDMKTKRIGLRRCELITKKDADLKGASMMFRINGHDIFCKGADWVPADAMPCRITREKYEYLLDSTVKANMNMLRVWGGGLYEADDFYTLCDEKGILIWHDFMFACMPYPANKEFLQNVREEAKHQVKRLKDHPSIVIWCGDNEVLESFGWFDDSKENLDLYYRNYRALNQVLARVVKKIDPERVFWPGSPSNGPGQKRENPQDQYQGDVHCWGVWHKRESFESYRKVLPRFCTEFGFQSYPSMQCIHRFARDKDLENHLSEIMAFHQRSPAGNETIQMMMADYFHIPENLVFEDYCWMSQVLQAIGIKTAIEHWRSLRPYCMGTLFWQLNDNWPVISWSSIDYTGKWKVLHYFAAHFFAPLIPILHPDIERGLRILLVYDLYTSIQAEVIGELFNTRGSCLAKEETLVSLSGPGAKEVISFSFPGEETNYKEGDVFLHISLKAMNTVQTNTFFLAPLKSYNLKNVQINSNIIEENGGPVILVTSEKPAFFVTLDFGEINGIFSDNCFTLIPGRGRKICFHAAEKTNGNRLKDVLKIKALGF